MYSVPGIFMPVHVSVCVCVYESVYMLKKKDYQIEGSVTHGRTGVSKGIGKSDTFEY